jgi:nucleoside-diphosphate-sugar epimerase
VIVGSGLMARAFRGRATDRTDVVVHAAGVSNSQCTDSREFERERLLLHKTISDARGAECLVYFSTCSVVDPTSENAPYVRHKLRMEAEVRAHPRHLILRLPQVAGRTPNPHTLLNYLHARIARGERFSIWGGARRNIIDCDDARALGFQLIEGDVRGETVNVACTHDHSLVEIVETLERATGGHAVYDVLDRGAPYPIDVARTQPFFSAAGVSFDSGYLERVIRKYYVGNR